MAKKNTQKQGKLLSCLHLLFSNAVRIIALTIVKMVLQSLSTAQNES